MAKTYHLKQLDGSSTITLSLEKVMRDIHDGTVSADTPAWAEGMEAWGKLSDFPEFAAALGVVAPPVEPTAPAGGSPSRSSGGGTSAAAWRDEASLPLVGTPGEASRVDAGGAGQKYGNLIQAGNGLRIWGEVLKVTGGVTMGGGACCTIYGIVDSLKYGDFNVALAIGPVVAFMGISCYAAGLFTAAAGEAGKALADIAVNTGKMADHG